MTAEAASLAEIDEVLERESESDWLSKADLDVLLLVFDVGVWAQRDGTRTDVSAAGELDALFCALDGDCQRS